MRIAPDQLSFFQTNRPRFSLTAIVRIGKFVVATGRRRQRRGNDFGADRQQDASCEPNAHVPSAPFEDGDDSPVLPADASLLSQMASLGRTSGAGRPLCRRDHRSDRALDEEQYEAGLRDVGRVFSNQASPAPNSRDLARARNIAAFACGRDRRPEVGQTVFLRWGDSAATAALRLISICLQLRLASPAAFGSGPQ
jgi:hypothetical protein